MFPIEDGRLRERVIDEILATELADNTRARRLFPDGSYRIPSRGSGEVPRRAQLEFIERAQEKRSRSQGVKPSPDGKLVVRKSP